MRTMDQCLMRDEVYYLLIDKIFRISGVLVKSSWTERSFHLLFDFPIEAFAYPHAKTCCVEIGSEKNVLFHFGDTYHFHATPKIQDVDAFLKNEEELLRKWINKGQYHKDPKTFLQMSLSWLFFKIIRRIFDFTWGVWVEEKEARRLEEMYKAQKDKFYFWDLVTNLVSKVWFFKMIIELKRESQKYVSILADLQKNEKLSLVDKQLINKIMKKLQKYQIRLGSPAYASEEEIVMVREFQEQEIERGFADRNKMWFKILQKILGQMGYSLRYQYPYGNDIDHFPIEICLSFTSEKFKGDGLGRLFIDS